MELPRHLKESLKDLGFTEYETSIYLTLVTEGALNAKELSKKSKVPYSRIYQILQSLIDKGFVLRNEEDRPTLYTATPPIDAIQNAKQRYFEDVNQKAKNLLDVLNPIYLMKSLPQKLEVFYLEGTDNCYLKLKELFTRTKEKLYFASGSLQIVDKFYDDIKILRLRGISDIKLVLQKDVFGTEYKTSNKFQKLSELGVIKMTPFMFGTMVISDDGKDSFFAFSKFLYTNDSLSGLFSENPVVGSIMKEWFNYIFKEAQET
jgi:HTH-type transcriptional regulator, sugar sensing transcriptional regulator